MAQQSVFFQRLGYYSGVSLLQFGALLFMLTVSGIYRPFYQPPEVLPAIIPVKIPKEVTIISGRPVRLVIPSIHLDRQLADGVYNSDDGTWTLSSTGIHYAIASAPANDYGGSTFIYAHSNMSAFGPLKNIAFGDTAELYTDNNLKFTYTFYQESKIDPTDTTPLTYQDRPPRLTLQTCSGNWHELRDMHYFKLTSVEQEQETT